MSDTLKALTDPFYAVQEKHYDRQNYAYWETLSRWETVGQAVENLASTSTRLRRIIKQRLDADSTGRVIFNELIIVQDESGNWHPLYDPRNDDPEWTEYIRLKNKFEENQDG